MQPRLMPRILAVLLLATLAVPIRSFAGPDSSLTNAIRQNDADAVRRALSRGRAELIADDTGTTLLMYAALVGSPEIIRLLVDHGAQVNASNRFGTTALMCAVSRTENVRALLERGADVKARTNNGGTALVAATRYGNVNAMKILLAAGADTSSPQVRRALFAASFFSKNPIVREVLSGAGVVATSSDEITGTVLDWTRDDIATLSSLLTFGVPPNEEIPTFTFPLPTFFMAARDGQIDAMRAFVEKGVDPAQKGARGWTALMFAASAHRSSIGTLKFLLNHGADVNAMDDNGRTALDWALTRGETDVSAFLRKAGGRTNSVPAPAPALIGTPRSARAAIEQAVARLQPAGSAFYAHTGCVSCHHESIAGIAIKMAKARGVKVDATIPSYSITATERSWRKGRDAALMGEFFVGLATVPYGLLERIEAGLPPTPDTDAMVVLAASRQTTDGSWQFPNEIRPPINGSTFVATALAIRALRTFAPPVHRRDMELQVARGRAFLEKSEPDETQDRAFKLLGLVWSGAPAHLIEKAKAALIALQRSNGGWGQMPTLDPDAYATGQALYALHAAGMAPTATTYRKGADYLLRTQLEDGTWFVRTRAFPVQPYFETGFPHGRSQFISTAATGWAAIALAYTLD
ncbi:MAG TPA: ankyrin repeat domain-containing protein [Vicinamibacterales bacterium]|nr:ankyrin repeat domain-containing protein [Vicinamibacterales bacterium]